MYAKSSLILIVCFCWLVETSHAFASTQLCQQWFYAKSYKKAAECFGSLAKKAQQQPKSSKKQVGNLLLNAALSWRKAATQEKRIEQSAYFREQACLYLKQHLQKRYYNSPTMKRYVKVLLQDTKRQIGYASLVVTTSEPDTSISVSGFQFRAKGRGSWRQRVRPGSYAIVLQSKRGISLSRTIVVKPHQPAALHIKLHRLSRLPDIRRTLPLPTVPVLVRPMGFQVASWAAVGLGLSTAIVGGVFLGMSGLSRGERDTLYQAILAKPESERTVPESEKLLSLEKQTQQQWTMGWALLGVGGAVATSGLLLYLLSPRFPRNVRPPTRSLSSSNTLFFAN